MISISRRELYIKIWFKGITKTAQELNVVYKKLKKVCISNDIPLPTASYWSSLHMGKEKPEQPALPNPDFNPNILIEEVKRRNKLYAETEESKSINNSSKTTNDGSYSKRDQMQRNHLFGYFEAEQILMTEVYSSLKVNKALSTKPHQQIVLYRKEKRWTGPYYREPILHISSKSDVIFPEVLTFIDSLFKALEKVGAVIKVTSKEIQVLYKNYELLIAFKIPTNKIMLTIDDNDYSKYKMYKFTPTGKMYVEVGYRVEWNSWNKHEKLIKQNSSDTLTDLLKKVFIYIFSLPKIIDEESETHRNVEEKRRLEIEIQKMIKEQHDKEYNRTKELLQKSVEYFYSGLVREYVVSEMDVDTEEYKWALNKSDWIKDSRKYPDSNLTNEDKENLISKNKSKSTWIDDY
ncbi:hypothetical protein DVB69_01330 [Sporosarcina sp. BI001-red]|uniref:hypothetical protein n=1 Tax=Sporosarcina sp. BI001-red TaxID=2282866 RepID=UPI000E27CFFC|nr:hypothetical protein [Sporosarcina sp. BI001-red]REB11009.1 hypothetical protein DVB69_01330 [Sporosarcina sp. BI001-red]